MLDLVALEPDDAELLEGSYNAIRQKDCLEIIVDKTELNKVYTQTVNSLTVPLNATLSFQNLLKLTVSNGHFYIAQCLLDFGYPVSRSLVQSPIRKYNFQIIGIANLKMDLGNSLLRPDTKIDKIVGRLFDHDIDFSNCEQFNSKYYLVSSNKPQIDKAFNYSFLDVLSKYDDIVLKTRNFEMYISFTNEIRPNQSRAVEDIFSNFKFLAD